MLDARNLGVMTIGLVAEPELITMKDGKIVKMRVAVPFAGSEKNSEDKRGFFDVTYFANTSQQNAQFVLNQIEAGNFKPGTTLQVVYSLRQERWENEEGKKNQKVVLIAETINYAATNKPAETGTDAVDVALPATF